jgi:hypothetical protein
VVRASSGNHVWLRPEALPELARVYGPLPADAQWEVVVIDSGYGKDGLHLELDGRRILAWRSQVKAVPRCDYCGLEGHVSSKGTAKTCPVRAEEVKESRLAQSRRMKERWAVIKAAEAGSPPAEREERAS